MTPMSAYSRFAARGAPSDAVEVAEEADVLRQRHAVDGSLLVDARRAQVAEAGLHLGHAVEREVVVREELERVPHLHERGARMAGVELEEAELHARPRRRLVLADRGGRRERHRALGVGGVADAARAHTTRARTTRRRA